MAAGRPAPQVAFGPSARQALVDHPDSVLIRKKARTIARRIDTDFVVQTGQGVVIGRAGDYLATNHPEDDPTSDVWPISKERFEASYERVES